MVRYCPPGLIAVAVLASQKGFAGKASVILLIQMLLIIVAHHIQRVKETDLRGQLRKRRRQCYRAALVLLSHNPCQMCRNHRKPLHVGLVRIIEPLSLRLVGIIIPGHGLKHGVAVRVIGVINLISNTPENNAGMVSVPSYHGPQVLLMPLWKVLKISLMPGRIDIMPYRPFVFRIFPFIKSLIHHEKSHGVTEGIKLRHMGIVTAPDGIASALLQLHKPVLPYRSTQA